MLQLTKISGSGVLNYTLDPNSAFSLEEVTLHLSATGGASEDFDITVDDVAGSEFDILINSQDMNAVSDYQYQPTRPLEYETGTTIDFTYTNTNTRIYGLTIKYRTIA